MRRGSCVLHSRAIVLFVVLLVLPIAFVGCKREEPPPPEPPFQMPEMPGYTAMTIPADNPMGTWKVELGKQLYYDARVSGDGHNASDTP